MDIHLNMESLALIQKIRHSIITFFANDILGNAYTEGCTKLKDGRLAFGTNYGFDSAYSPTN